MSPSLSSHSSAHALTRWAYHSDEPYEPNEPTFDDDEPMEVLEPEAHVDDDHEDAAAAARAADNADAEQADSVANAEKSAAANGAKKPVKKNTMTDKRVPNDKRTTTPYMTKYERARVLGTRAQQIRCVLAVADEVGVQQLTSRKA